MWPEPGIVTVAAPAISWASFRLVLGGVITSLPPITRRLGQATRRAAAGPEFQRWQAVKSALRTPGRLRASRARLMPVRLSPGWAVPPSLASPDRAQPVIS